MKRTLLFAAVSLALAGCSSHDTVIVGEVGGLDDGYVYLADAKHPDAIIDSAAVAGGKFRFDLDGVQPSLLRLGNANEEPVAFFYAEKGKVTISGSLTDDTVTAAGTPANDAHTAFSKAVAALREELQKAASQEEADAVEARYDELVESTTESNRDNIFGADLYIRANSYDLPAAKMKQYLTSLPDALRETPTVREALDLAERKLKTEPQVEGSDYVPHYIDIVQSDPDGQEISLASVVGNPKNRYVLLDFWASWCGPCMREVPELVAAYGKYHARGLEIYGVSFDRDADAWKGALSANGMKWVNVSALASFDNQAAEDYAVQAIPTNYLIDCSNGVIIAKNLRGDAVAEKFAELFQ